MKFRNKKTGIVLELGDDFQHPSWEPVKAPGKAAEIKAAVVEDEPKAKKEPAKKATSKKTKG